MPSPLHLLILEDRSADAELMLHELRRAGLAVDWRRVETEADYVAALDPALDLILADYSLPQFNALRALQLLQQRGLDIPFIIVTGTISEEVAVECMKQGAADYLLKDRMARLDQAVAHALEQKRLRVENQRAAEALRESEARFRVIFEHANDAIHVSNAADEILEVNLRMCEMMGYSRAELLKMHIADLQAPEVRGSSGSVITNELARFGSTTFEGLNLHHSGRPIPVEISVARMESAQGELFVSIVRDITERKRAEQALRASEQKYRKLHESMIDGFVYVDMQGNIIDSNPSYQQMLGYSFEELTRRTYRDLTPEKWHAAEQAIADEQILPRGYSDIYEKEYRRKDGTIFPIEIHTFLIKNDAGENEGMWAIVRDITEREQAQEALRESEERYRAIFENASIGIFQSTPAGRYLSVNPAMARIYGYDSPEEMLASITDIASQIHVNPARRQEFRRRLTEHGEILEFTNENYRKDGSRIHTSTDARVVKDQAGKVLYYEGFMTDITARQQAEAALMESSAQFRTLFEASPDAIMLIDPHDSWLILDCNMAACQMNGYTRDELIGQSVDVLNLTPGHPTERAEYLERLRQIGVLRVETFHRHKDGAVFPIEVSTSLITLGGRDVVLGIDRDITERKWAERALRESEERFRGALDNIPDVVVIYDHDLRIQYINAATRQIAGRPASDYIGQRDVDIWPPEICGTWLPTLRAALETRTTRSVEIDLVLPDSGFRSLNITCVPLLNEAGEVREILGITHDFTKRKQAEEVIRESARRERERAAELQTIMDIVPATIWIARDQMCQIITGNRAAYESRRLPPDSNISLTVPGNEVPTHYRIYQNGVELPPNDLPLQVTAATGVEIRDFEEDIVFDDGTIVHELGNVVPLFDEQGRPRGAVAAFVDITERKQAEEALRESEERYRTLVELSPDSIGIHCEGKVVYVNAAMVKLFHADRPEDLIGLPVFQFVHPDYRAIAMERVRRSYENHLPASLLEEKFVTLDGRLIDVEVAAAPIVHESKPATQIIIHNITARKQAEEALRRAEEKYHDIFENSLDGIFQSTPTGRFITINPALAGIWGYASPDDLIASVTDIAHQIYVDPERRTEFVRLMKEMGKVSAFEFRVFRKDGSVIWVSESAHAVQDTKGTLLYYEGTVKDITERKQAEDALQKSESSLQAVLQSTADGILAVGSENEVLYANERFVEMWRIPQVAMASKDDSVLLQHVLDQLSDPQSFLKKVQELYKSKEESFDTLYFKDGRVFERLSRPLLHGTELRGRVWSFRDITERKQVEEKLEESEERYRGLVEQTPDMIGMLVEERLVYLNQSGARLFGAGRPGQMLGKAIADYMHPDDLPAIRERARRAAENGTPNPLIEFRIIRLDGAVTEMEGVSIPFVYQGKPATQFIARDITERKQAEEALRASKLIIEGIINAIPVRVFWKDKNLVYLGCNAVFARDAGFTDPKDVIGKDDYQMGWRDQAELYRGDDRQVIESGSPKLHVEEPQTTPEGNTITLLTSKVPLRSSKGEVIGVLGTYMDITERKQAEDALRESEERFRAISEAAGDLIFTITPDGMVSYANEFALRVFSVTPQALIGRQLRDLFPPEVFEQQWNFLQKVFETGEPLYEESISHFPHGDVWLSTWLTPLRDNTGRIAAVLGDSRDITERKRMEVQLHDKVATLQALAEIDREITAATESKSILDLVCRRAAELVHAPKSAIVTWTAAAEMEMTANYGLRNAARVSVEFAHARQTGSMNLSVLSTREVIALNEITDDTRVMPETVSSEGVRALAIVPLAAGEEPSGALIVLDTTARQWLADELQVLSMLAGQAAIALEKLRLLQAARSRATHLATLNEIGQAITSSLDLDRVLVALLEKVRQATEAEACSVALIDQVSGDLVFRQAVGGATHLVIGLRLQTGEGLAGWVALHKQSVLVPDVAADVRAHKLDDSSGFATRDLIGVPLIAHDAVIGVIELINKRSGRFGEDDRRLLESVAAHAAIAIENARLFETEHAGRQSLETLYRIGQAINSTLDADTILDRLTDEAMRTTHATHGSALVVRPDRGCFERRSLRGYSPELVEQARSNWLPLDRGVNGRAYRLRQTVNVGDVYNDPDYYSLVPDTRSELAIPIMRGGQVIGSLDLQSPEVDTFREVNLDFLGALTDQVAIALENARLFDETRRHMDEMSIVSQVALVGAAGRPFDETVARATGALSRLWPTASLGFLFVDKGGQSLHLHPAASPLITAAVSVPVDQGISGWAVRERQPIRVGNVTADPRYLLTTPDIRSEMAAPLVVGQRAIGVVDVQSSWLDAFSGDDLRLLTTLAGQLATIFEKARLDAELVDHAARLEQRVQERTAEIRREQTRTQAILDALGEGVVVTDTQGTIQYMNPAMEQVTGYSARESIGQNPRLWQSGQTPVEVYQAMWATVLAGQTWRGEIVNRRKDGELYFASLAAAPIPAVGDSHDPLAGLVGIQRDITGRIQAEEDMRRALEKEKELNNLKSNFVSLTSHEFRTPLTTILSSAEMLEYYSTGWTTERKQEHLHRIQTAVKYMTTLLNDILIIGKAEAGKLEFMPTPLDLVKFCRDLMEEIQLTDKANHTLIFDGEVECAQASMDEHLLRHILSNLLSNALKYSPQGGIVQFDLTCPTGQAVFRIQDHGMGIPPEDQARLFETFHRASNVRNIAGTGLGLAIVKRSVDLHGGTIDVASQVGVGTTVTVTLPLGASSDT